MVVYEKIYFEAYTNDQYIWHKNNIAQLYFILGRAELRWNFSSWLKDASDIYRLPILHMVKTHFLLENLWISKPSLSILKKFQRSSALPNIKYNCSILFLCQMYRSFVYASKYIFSQTTIIKPSQNWLVCSKTHRIYWSSCTVRRPAALWIALLVSFWCTDPDIN